jgi:hypothetical protein
LPECGVELLRRDSKVWVIGSKRSSVDFLPVPQSLPLWSEDNNTIYLMVPLWE